MKSTSLRRYIFSYSNLYIARYFLMWFFLVTFSVIVIVFLFEVAEKVRMTISKPNAHLETVMMLAAMKIPEHLINHLPFVFLISSVSCFWKFGQHHEVAALKSFGVSGSQIAISFFFTAIVIGISATFFLNPLASMMSVYSKSFEQNLLGSNQYSVTFAKNGFWLKESNNHRKLILHSAAYIPGDVSFGETVLFLFNGAHKFEQRIDCKNAQLKSKEWVLKDCMVWRAKQQDQYYREHLVLPTKITKDNIQRSFSEPSQMPFWRIPEMITQLKQNDMSSLKFELFWQKFWSQILMLGIMSVFAVAISFRPPRFHAAVRLISFTFVMGFLVHILTKILNAYGESGQLPPFLAAWLPPLIFASFTIGYLLHVEDSA